MANIPDILQKIIVRKQEEIISRQRQRSVSELRELAASADATRGFIAALQQKLQLGQPAVIAEVKKASPSKGVLRANFDPVEIARSYSNASACCLSVLTDADFFQGSEVFLTQARSACALPVIRKDFIIDPYQVVESRSIDADCILLIAAVLDNEKLIELFDLAGSLGMDVLIEVHNREELERVLPVAPTLIGINNRDLRTFDVDLQTTLDLLDAIPETCQVVTESGILGRQDVALMRQHGVNAFLIGEAFMRADDPGSALEELFA